MSKSLNQLVIEMETLAQAMITAMGETQVAAGRRQTTASEAAIQAMMKQFQAMVTAIQLDDAIASAEKSAITHNAMGTGDIAVLKAEIARLQAYLAASDKTSAEIDAKRKTFEDSRGVSKECAGRASQTLTTIVGTLEAKAAAEKAKAAKPPK